MTIGVRSFGIFVDQGFSLVSYASIVGALHEANRASGGKTFAWQTVSPLGANLISGCGVALESQPIVVEGKPGSRLDPVQCVVLLSNVRGKAAREAVLAWMRESLVRGGKVLSLAGGTELLCEEGVLDGRRCAVHWSNFGVAIETFPGVAVSRAHYEIDGPFHTCAGELSTFDVMMRLIERYVDAEIVELVSSQVLQGAPRNRGERQPLPNHARLERFGSLFYSWLT